MSSYETKDLIASIKRSGHTPVQVNIDSIVVKIKANKVTPSYLSELTKENKIDFGCAALRYLGIIKDYEQFCQRIWAVRSIEMNGIYVANNIRASIKAGDKLGTLMELASHGLPVPPTVASEKFFSGYEAVKEFKEAVVKPLRSGKGLGVFKVDDPDIAMHIFSYFTNLSKPIYVQKYLNKIGGGDYRVVVVGGQVIGAEFRKGKDWKSNVAQGATAKAVKPDKELTELAIKTAQVMGLDYVGVDIANTKDGYCILETNPTLTWIAFKQATNVNPADFIIKDLIKKAKS
ncbi:MAG: RimK family alpha-L-glutamate ligase [Candidatus Micrarchaeota archaeon]|nr:RimK family alpha-L-glutamate ligase [Candidatus Micrarchaeota archaeon]MDE1834101.1 RimK family alpha-L-glutamate ligase [Candidatus Micrarchaeota archaeon]MDE1859347.1 RimK family alpha-L-glutamate ligase [Candidatus Micrarchaeota archaeon]